MIRQFLLVYAGLFVHYLQSNIAKILVSSSTLCLKIGITYWGTKYPDRSLKTTVVCVQYL
jgi:hypothetical protein